MNDLDRSDFIDRLAAVAQDGAMDIYAWTWPSHADALCLASKALIGQLRSLSETIFALKKWCVERTITPTSMTRSPAR